MEGMYDGAASDSCFLCGLLFPERYQDDCPRCHRRMRYHPAVHMDGPSLEKAIGSAARRYQSADSADKRHRLEELLTLLHRFAPQSLDSLSFVSELELGQLRKHWKALTSPS